LKKLALRRAIVKTMSWKEDLGCGPSTKDKTEGTGVLCMLGWEYVIELRGGQTVCVKKEEKRKDKYTYSLSGEKRNLRGGIDCDGKKKGRQERVR